MQGSHDIYKNQTFLPPLLICGCKSSVPLFFFFYFPSAPTNLRILNNLRSTEINFQEVPLVDRWRVGGGLPRVYELDQGNDAL